MIGNVPNVKKGDIVSVDGKEAIVSDKIKYYNVVTGTSTTRVVVNILGTFESVETDKFSLVDRAKIKRKGHWEERLLPMFTHDYRCSECGCHNEEPSTICPVCYSNMTFTEYMN